MNKYYETLDENFTQALNLCAENQTHEELIELLSNGNVPQKQIAAIKLKEIKSSYDADVLMGNLTGQDGKIREVVSMRIKEFLSSYADYFDIYSNSSIFIDAITDINANICRNVIDALKNLHDDNRFCDIFCQKLLVLIEDLLDIVEKFDFQDGKYKVNKEAFKLYWALETLNYFYDKLKLEDLRRILLRSSNIGEYTIREKVAKILSNDIDDVVLNSIRLNLKNDKNYYVRRF